MATLVFTAITSLDGYQQAETTSRADPARAQCMSAGTKTAERNHNGLKPQRSALFAERTLVKP